LSKEDVETFWRGMTAAEGDLDGVLEAFDEEIEFLPLRSAVEGPYHGLDGIRKWWADTAASWETFSIRADGVRDLGDGRLVARGVIHAEGKGGGVPLDIPTSWLMEMRNARIRRAEFFFDQEGAFRAAGLSQ
jgi:ketosteroid isomerase-like protein